MSLDELLPMCAVCKKPVDRITQMPRFDQRIVFVVECHGETEETQISYQDLFNKTKITAGTAFNRPKLQADSCAGDSTPR